LGEIEGKEENFDDDDDQNKLKEGLDRA